MNLTTLNVLDGLIIVIFGWNLIRGFNKGFVEEVISVVGIVLSAYLSYRFSPLISETLLGRRDLSSIFASGAAIFLVAFLTTKYIASYLNGKLNKTALGTINNLLGFLFGIFRGWILASLAVFAVAVIAPDGYLIKKSSLGGVAVPVVNTALRFLPVKEEGEDPLLKNWLTAQKYLKRNFILREYVRL